MSQAKSLHSKPDLSPAIARLRQIVAEAGDHLLLGDGPPHPDAKLLDLCAEALHHLRAAETAYRDRPMWKRPPGRDWTPAELAEDNHLMHTYHDGITRAKPPLVLIAKLPPTTAAGIYAKALAVRASQTGAAKLAMTLADDLVNNHALRAALWADDQAPEPAVPDNVVPLASRGRDTA